ncbi:cofactor assembly of complex C isoform X1 [Tasmannia lanceolata]|uniref:cofactor assembly of complex C isoform X1 n=1 Tax=Tasmannia lanceolata TaxID=3420 RepID=UPI004064C409
MAAKFLSSPLSSSSSFPFPSKPKTHQRYTHPNPWLELPRAQKPTRLVVHLSLHDPIISTSTLPILFSLTENVGYSLASYYTSLGLFVISVPGLWSLIKRSVKSKIVKKTFIGEEKKAPKQAAGEILSFFTRNNFVVSDRGETITIFNQYEIQSKAYQWIGRSDPCIVYHEVIYREGFTNDTPMEPSGPYYGSPNKRFEGMMVPSRGQAALLTFCTCISLASVALVLTITVPEGGNNWFWLTVLSPLAGVYYWKRASRKEQIKVKMIVGEDGASLSEIVVQGDDQQVEQMRKELQLSEKGMIYVKGVFER